MSPASDRAAMELLWRAVRSDVPIAELGAFRSTGRLAVGPAITLYKNAYWIRQHAVLRELFPRLVTCLGEPRFRELVRTYLRAIPSAHPELEYLGTALPAYLRAHPDPALARWAGLAAFELALTESGLAHDSAAARVEDIRPSTFVHARLRFVPSLRVVVTDKGLLHVLAQDALEVVGAHAAVIVRPVHGTRSYLIGRPEHELLELARGGATIGELLERYAHEVSGVHAPLSRWFQRHWIAKIEVIAS